MAEERTIVGDMIVERCLDDGVFYFCASVRVDTRRPFSLVQRAPLSREEMNMQCAPTPTFSVVSERVTAGWYFTQEKAVQRTLEKLVRVVDPMQILGLMKMRVVAVGAVVGQATYLDRLEK